MNRRIPLIVGLVLALGTGLLMLNYLTSTRTAGNGKVRTVVTALRDIPARAQIDGTMVGISTRPVSEVDSDALEKTNAAIGAVSLITIPSGSIVTSSKVGRLSALSLPNRLRNGLRAVSISIDKVKGVSGLVQPGDRVDVIAVPPRVANETPRATTILRGALVLALGGETEMAHATPSPDNQNSTTVTLAVTPRQADLLALADVNTVLRLALRPPGESIRAYPAEPLELGVAPQPATVSQAPPQRVTVKTVEVLQRPKLAQNPSSAQVPMIDGDRLVLSTGPR